jgi:hypothetical protein
MDPLPGQKMGWDRQPPASMKAQGMRIVLAETFIQKEMSLLTTGSKKPLASRPI